MPQVLTLDGDRTPTKDTPAHAAREPMKGSVAWLTGSTAKGSPEASPYHAMPSPSRMDVSPPASPISKSVLSHIDGLHATRATASGLQFTRGASYYKEELNVGFNQKAHDGMDATFADEPSLESTAGASQTAAFQYADYTMGGSLSKSVTFAPTSLPAPASYASPPPAAPVGRLDAHAVAQEEEEEVTPPQVSHLNFRNVLNVPSQAKHCDAGQRSRRTLNMSADDETVCTTADAMKALLNLHAPPLPLQSSPYQASKNAVTKLPLREEIWPVVTPPPPAPARNALALEPPPPPPTVQVSLARARALQANRSDSAKAALEPPTHFPMADFLDLNATHPLTLECAPFQIRCGSIWARHRRQGA